MGYTIHLKWRNTFRGSKAWELYEDDKAMFPRKYDIIEDRFRNEVSVTRREIMKILFEHATKINALKRTKHGYWKAKGRVLRGYQEWEHYEASFPVGERVKDLIFKIMGLDFRKKGDREQGAELVKQLQIELQTEYEQQQHQNQQPNHSQRLTHQRHYKA